MIVDLPREGVFAALESDTDVPHSMSPNRSTFNIWFPFQPPFAAPTDPTDELG